MKKSASFSTYLFALLGVGSLCQAHAANLYSSDLSDGTGWSIIADEDTSAQFGWDYSALGIPAAPNGSDTIGLRLASNITDAGSGAAAITAATPGSFSGSYHVQYDFWLNYYTSGGTTEFGGGGVGFSTAGAPLNGLQLMVVTDGDTATDYRFYTDGVFQGLDSGAYSIFSLNSFENPDLEAAFPSSQPPQKQLDELGQNFATNPAGTFGFGWHTMDIVTNGSAGTATFSIDGIEFGTLSGNLDGAVGLTQWDAFGSVAGNADLAFGVFDNLSVEAIPEPSTSTLLLACVGFLGLRRRRR